MSCSLCGSDVPAGARFCPSCGTSQVGGDEERRVITVVFADIVGFTALSEKLDPEHVKRQVDHCFVQLTRDITSFGGVVDKIVGDEIVALFGAPVAHEDDAERAVRAALRMQQSLAAMAAEAEFPFEVRIGINSGEVLVGSSASGRDYTAMGDVMNTASRLQTMAQPGEVVVGGSTYLATFEAISYDALGLLEAKGRAGHVEAWIARSAVRPPGARTRRESAFVGRTAELQVLHAQSRLAIELGQAQFTMLYGEAGMGKTRLAEELADRLESEDDALVLRGHCVPYGEANVWWPVAEVLRQLFGLGIDDSTEQTKAAIAEALSCFGLPSDTDLERFGVAAAHALGHPTILRNGNRDRNRAEVTLLLTSLFEIELGRRPVILLLSDMHWAAEAVWGLVHHVVMQLCRSRFMVVLTARRTGEEHLPTDGRFGRLGLELGPLDPAAAHDFVSQLDAALAPSEIDELIERSGGNPFFLEELAELVKRQELPAVGDDSGERLAGVPDTLRGILAARLDRLDTDARRALEAAAVIGRSGPVVSIRRLLEDAGFDGDVDAGLAALIDNDIISIDGSRFVFVSDLTREVAYGTITKTSRARTHTRIGRFLEATNGPPYRNSVAVAIARHYRSAAQLAAELAAGDAEERADVVAKAAYWLAEAGWRALDAGVPVEAAEWFGAALEFTPPEQQHHLFYGRAEARSLRRDLAGTRADLDHLDQLAFDDPLLRAKALVIRGDVDAKAGDLDGAIEVLTEAIKCLNGLGDAAAEARALRRLGMADMLRGDDVSARSSLELSRRVATEAGERREEAWALHSLAVLAHRFGSIDEARAFVDEAADIFTEIDDGMGLGWAIGLKAWVAFHEGDWTMARRLVDDVLPEIRRRGDPWAEAIMMLLDASMRLWSGQSRAALEIARDAQAVAERAEDFSLAVQARAVEGRALISGGRVAEGLAALEQSAALADRAGNAETRRLAMISNCAASARLGDADRAIRWAARFEGVNTGQDVIGESDLTVSLALALLQRGSPDEAASKLKRALRCDDGAPTRRSDTFALCVGAVIAAAQGDVELTHQRVDLVLAGEATYLDQAMALLARAAAHRQRDELDLMRAAVADARAVVARTDDQVTPLMLSLVEALLSGDDVTVEQDIIAMGIDPSGWRRSWTLASTGADRSSV